VKAAIGTAITMIMLALIMIGALFGLRCQDKAYIERMEQRHRDDIEAALLESRTAAQRAINVDERLDGMTIGYPVDRYLD